jgi:hypothetical protein
VKRRRQSPGPRSKPRTTRAEYDCLDVLTGDEAQIVLKNLLSSRPDLISDARPAANALLATVSLVDVAADVFDALQGLDLDDLDAGPRPGGYVEPLAAAWNAVEKVATPYLHDLERRVKLRHEDQALEVCKGIVLGLYRATLWRSGAADAGTANSRATSSRSTRPIGHGSLADETTAALFKAADHLPATSSSGPCCLACCYSRF